MIAIMLLLALVTGGCININLRLQPEDPSVKEILKGQDCALIVLGFGFGTATVESALMKGVPITSARPDEYYRRIMKVRRVESSERTFLIFGKRCVEVVGE